MPSTVRDSGSGTSALIGRDHPAAVLRAEIERAVDSHGGLVLVTGEAGIGKTALVTGAMEESRRLGALVLGGSCWESDSAPGYWPWMQVIRGLRRGASAEEWAAAQEAAGGGLAVLLGEATSTEAVEEFHLYDAVTTALVSVSQRRPVVVVLDDLHWADAASLRLLEFAAQHTWFERLLLVGTYRDVEVESAEHPLQPLMTPLVAKATTVTLTGLGRDEVGALMTRTAGEEPAAELVEEVHRRTGGNPFFVEQTARLWHGGGSVTTVAPGVRDAVRRRLSLLPEPVVQLLTAAAVLGREFHRQVLAATVAAPVPHVDRLLEQAVTARLAVVRGGGRFEFAHDLVRETLYDSIDDADRRRRHADVVSAIDQSPALAERIFPADLARHAYLAGTELASTAAVDHLLAAAQDADSRLATDEAIGHLRRALEVVDEPARRVRIQLDLGEQLHRSGERRAGWQHFEDAAALARELDHPELLARAALVAHRNKAPDGRAAQFSDDLLRQAHRRLLGDSVGPDGALGTDRLVHDLIAGTEALARRGSDDEALTFSLWARHNVLWGPGTAREREALCAEMVTVARRSADPGTEQFAASLLWVALLEQGDPRYLDQFHTFLALTERTNEPRFRLASVVDGSIIAALMGRFGEAQALLAQMQAAGDHGHSEWTHIAQHLQWALWLLQGRFAEIDELLHLLGQSHHPHLDLLRAITAVEQGEVEAALGHLLGHLDQAPRYGRHMVSLWLRFQAQVAAATGDPELCERARGALDPYRGEWAVSLYGCDISGPMDLWIATVDAAQRRWDDAIAGFTAARDSADRLQARPWSIRARAGLAGALTGRGAAGDRETAAALLADVQREAAELGMRHQAPLVPPVAGPRPVAVNEFRRDGAVWSLTFGGRTIHQPDAKGLHDLHLLLSRPGSDVPAVQLLSPEGGEAVVAARRMGGDPILDEEARTRYRRRLDQLDEEIDRAAERGEDRRAMDLDRERAALLAELRAAAGLAGRSRRLGDEAERARKAVTARIRDTLRKLDARHPELAGHLRATVSTGITCRYAPDEPISWRL